MANREQTYSAEWYLRTKREADRNVKQYRHDHKQELDQQLLDQAVAEAARQKARHERQKARDLKVQD